MAAEKDPFDPYVQELQGQEAAIARKLEIIAGVIGQADVELDRDEQRKLQRAKEKFITIKKAIALKKVDDLEQELEDLEDLIRDPEKFHPPQGGATPPPPAGWPPGWPWPFPWPFPTPGSSSSSSSSSSTGTGTTSADNKVPPNAATVAVGTAELEFIFARSKQKVWVWHPKDNRWAAELDTGSDIVEMAQVDGTIAVRTATALWLFRAPEYIWLGPLQAEVEEVTAFKLAYPVVVNKSE